MSTNKILISDERRLTNLVKLQSRNIRELKTPQKIGADVLDVQSLPTADTVLGFPGGSTTYNTGSGGILTINYAFTPNSSTLTLWNFLVSLYIDPTSFNAGGIPDSAHLYPTGGSLTNGMRTVKVESWIDWATSSDTTNIRRLIVNINNQDSVPHNYAIFIKAYLPNLNQAA